LSKTSETKNDPFVGYLVQPAYFVMACGVVLMLFVLYSVVFVANEEPATTITTPEILTSRNGIPYVKDCIEGVEYVIIAKGFHNAAMAMTGRNC